MKHLKRALSWLAKAFVEALILFILYGIATNIVDDRCSRNVSADENEGLAYQQKLREDK